MAASLRARFRSRREAEIGTRTFFSYFATKEELLFPESDARVRAAVEAIASRGPDDGPAEGLLRALNQVGDDSDDMVSRPAALRLLLAPTQPTGVRRGA